MTNGMPCYNIKKEFQGVNEPYTIDLDIYYFLLQECINRKTPSEGHKFHTQMLVNGVLTQSVFLVTKLVNMYSYCWSVKGTCQVFNEIPKWNVSTWNFLFEGCVRDGHFQEALELYYQMKQGGVSGNTPFQLSWRCVLRLRPYNRAGKSIVTWNTTTTRYFKIRNCEEAGKLLDEMELGRLKLDVIIWSLMISKYE